MCYKENNELKPLRCENVYPIQNQRGLTDAC